MKTRVALALVVSLAGCAQLAPKPVAPEPTPVPATAPAPRPLEYYPVRIENGVVKIDVAAPRRRERFEPDQATRI